MICHVQFPRKLVPIFAPPRGSVRYRCAKGGRGSGKSFNFAKMAAIWAAMEPLRVLCVREFQASIKESFHAELKAAIESEPWLQSCFEVGVDYIRGIGPFNQGGWFIFRGLARNIGTIKSLQGIDLTIVEEAEDVPEASWLALEATVFRKPKSELWAIWNPKKNGSPVDNRFVKRPPSDMLMAEVNWNDNPFFPTNLEKLRQSDLFRLDYETYLHVWEGHYLINSAAQIFANKYTVKEFDIDPAWDGPYQGGDFGFSQDPLAVVRCYISACGNYLMVSNEGGKVQLELDDTGKFVCEAIPGFEKYTTRWDNARPESISHIKRASPDPRRKPLPLSVAVDKWPGSIEDGISYLKSFKQIYVHPRCPAIAKEMALYSYKVDRLSGDITDVIVDAFNHYIDALRYAVTPMIKRNGYSLHELKKAVG